MLFPFYNGVEAPLSYVERLVETLRPIGLLQAGAYKT